MKIIVAIFSVLILVVVITVQTANIYNRRSKFYGVISNLLNVNHLLYISSKNYDDKDNKYYEEKLF